MKKVTRFTSYSVLVSLFCLLTNSVFPFIPIQITLVDACIEAYPSFLTITECDIRRIRGKFLNSALTNAAPFGITVSVMIMMIILLSPFTQAENRMAMYILLMIVSMAAVIKSCIPFDALRAFICITMVLGTPCALMIFPGLFEVTAVSGIMLKFIVLAGLCCLVLAMSLAGITKISGNLQKDRKSSRTAV